MTTIENKCTSIKLPNMINRNYIINKQRSYRIFFFTITIAYMRQLAIKIAALARQNRALFVS